MNSNRVLALAAVAILVGRVTSPLPAAVQTPLIGADFFNGRLFDVNPATGAATNPRDTGIFLLNAIAFSPGATLYGMSNGSSITSPNSLFTLDPLSGAATLIGPTGLTDVVEGDLAFHPATGVLYGSTAAMPGEPGRLFTVNPATGAATIIGPVGQLQTDLSAIEFVSDGRLLALESINDRLLSLDPATGAILSNVPLSVSIGVAAGLARHPMTGVMYAVDGDEQGTGNLYTLHPDTGVLSLVGPTGLTTGLASLAFVPEPGALSLPIIGSLAFIRHFCRRSAPLRS